MRILDLSLTYHWYDMIASGVKKEEYRAMKEFYFKRLNMEWHMHLEDGCFKGCMDFLHNHKGCAACKKFQFFPYDTIRFHRGQGGKTSMLVQITGMRIGTGNPEWGAEPGEVYFVLELGKIYPFTEAELEWAICNVCDCVPYSSPNYAAEVEKMAIGCLCEMNDPNSETNRIAAEHDRMLEAGLIDH